MKMKRILSLALALVMCLSLAACGKSGDEGPAVKNEPAEEHPEFVYAAEYKTLVEGTKNFAMALHDCAVLIAPQGHWDLFSPV